jgi:hypothetical protein
MIAQIFEFRSKILPIIFKERYLFLDLAISSGMQLLTYLATTKIDAKVSGMNSNSMGRSSRGYGISRKACRMMVPPLDAEDLSPLLCDFSGQCTIEPKPSQPVRDSRIFKYYVSH